METALKSIWSQCLGVSSIEPTANFFELGGDSLIAISVAMTASKQGLDLTPQDLYENQTISSLARALVARYAEGGLARHSLTDAANPRSRRTSPTSSNTVCVTAAAGAFPCCCVYARMSGPTPSGRF